MSNANQAFFEGWESKGYERQGSFVDAKGVLFRVWAPNAEYVYVVGDFNNWNVGQNKMEWRDGLWEIYVEGACCGQHYKYAIQSKGSPEIFLKADPYAKQVQYPPETASVVYQSSYQWTDHDFVANCTRNQGPMTIYELHLGSWRRPNGEIPTFRNIVEDLIGHLTYLNITHVEFMPLTYHPFYGSWGYQCLGYFAPTRQYGEPDDLKYLIDRLHQAGIGCILDWVPAHFPMDAHGLYQFDGQAIYEHPDPKRGFHKDWNTAIFDFGRPEVRSFLLSSARYWIEEFHFDALRVDAVASMLYLDYSREDGEWWPNADGGNENYDSVHLFKILSEMIESLQQGHLLIAEESTSWPNVSKPISEGGLGFTHKWDMGWMHDTLSYFKREPIHRQYHHNEITFRGIYAFHENFVLALSHDEVVYGKGSLMTKMAGDNWQKRAQCRLIFAWMAGQSGKKMIFMGMEFGQIGEWNHDAECEWHLLEQLEHQQLQACYSDMNHFYLHEKALHDDTFNGTIYSAMDDNQNSVIGFVRQNGKEKVLVVYNFTPVPLQDYAIGVPNPGRWIEVFNTDKEEYGGSGVVCREPSFSSPEALHGFQQHIKIGIPPLGASFWKNVDQ